MIQVSLLKFKNIWYTKYQYIRGIFIFGEVISAKKKKKEKKLKKLNKEII